MKRSLAVLAFLITFAAPAALLAHEGHAHHIMGTVHAIAADHIEVKDTAGKIVSCQLTDSTRYLRGDQPVAASDVKVGERVMVEASDRTGPMVAVEVRLGGMEM